MMFTAIVFDFDGTLVDSNAVKRQGYFDVVAGDPGGEARMAAVLGQVSGDRRAVFAAYAASLSAAGSLDPAEEPARVNALVDRYSERVDAAVAAAPEMQGATPLLRALRDHGRQVYLSSATPRSNLLDILQRRGWGALFDGVFGHPASKQATLRSIQLRHALNATALAVVGDGRDDFESASALGCAFFAVGRQPAPGLRVHGLPELLGILLAPQPSIASTHHV